MKNKYCSIQIDALIIYAKNISVDVYIALSDDKMVKVVSRDVMDFERLNKYKEKGINFCFMIKNDFDFFVKEIRTTLIKAMNNEFIDTKIENEMIRQSSAHDVLKSLFKSEVFDKESKKLAYSLTDRCLKTIASSRFFSELNHLRKFSTDAYLHAVMTSYLSSIILNKFSWGSEEVKSKVVLASFLCDITLTDDELKNHRNCTYKKACRDDHIFNHPIDAMLLVQKSKFIPNESLTIIANHHERPNSKGYPKGVGAESIKKLTAVYIVSYFFIDCLFYQNLDHGIEKEQLDLLMGQVHERYHTGPFAKIYTALNEIVYDGSLFA